MRTTDEDTARQRAASYLQHLHPAQEHQQAQLWEQDRAEWSRWVTRQARHLSHSVAYRGSPLEHIEQELREVLERQCYRCPVCGLVLVPVTLPGEREGTAPHSPWLATLQPLGGARVWASGRWRIVSQLAAVTQVYGEREADRYALGQVQTRRLHRQKSRRN
jgi:hypothetical protein